MLDLFRRFIRSRFQRQSASLRNPPQWLIEALSATPTAAGLGVTEASAMTFTAFYACVRVLSEEMAALPLKIYRRTSDSRKIVAPNHPLYRRLHVAANPYMTSFTFRETMQYCLCTHGNAYAELKDEGDGPKTFWPIHPAYVIPEIDEDEKLKYKVRNPRTGAERTIDPEDILHIRALSANGLVGISPIRAAREAIGLGLATEQHGAAFFGQGARPGGVLQHPGSLDDTSYDRLRRDWNAVHQGPGHAHQIAILEEGMQWQTIGIPNEDAQFLETRRFQVSEMARIFRIPPHMIGDLEKATFSNIEQQAIEFIRHCLRPWMVRWEQELNIKLLGDQDEYFAEFEADAVLRGDTEARYKAYQTAISYGIVSPNEVRHMENLNPYVGGDRHFMSANIVPIPDDNADTTGLPQAINAGYRRINRKAAKVIRQAVKHRNGDLVGWIRKWYSRYLDEVDDVMGDMLVARFVLMGQSQTEARRNALAHMKDMLSAHCDTIISLLDDPERLEATLREWEEVPYAIRQ